MVLYVYRLYFVIYLGLQFRLTELKESQSFTYATLPGVNSIPLDWKSCCAPDSDLPSEHVIYYQLTDTEKSLVDVVEEHCDEDSNVVGLIIINFMSSNFLPSEILNRGMPQKPPIYVVTQEDGEQIIEFFNTQVNDGDIKVKVLAENDVDSMTSGLKSMYICDHNVYMCSCLNKHCGIGYNFKRTVFYL